ncbi:hypothetical protein ACVBGC_31690 [Burkholderia stagnalis]
MHLRFPGRFRPSNSGDAGTSSDAATDRTNAGEPAGQAGHGLLDGLSKVTRRLGGKTGKGLEKAEPEVGAAAAASYQLWAASNATAAGNGLASTFHGANEQTHVVGEATNGIGMLPQALDITATALSMTNKTVALAKTASAAKDAKPGTLAGNDALVAHDLAKSNVLRAAPGAIRDVGVGTLAEVGRGESAAHHGQSMYGDHAVIADGAIGVAGSAMYIAAGAMTSAKVDRGVDRIHGLRAAVTNPVSARKDSSGAALRELDDLYASDRIGSNAYAILRTRSDAEVARFVKNFNALGLVGQKKLLNLLHFPSTRNAVQVLNMGRTTNLNTASMRRGAREAVIDTLIDADVRPGRNAAVLDAMKTARSEALGAKSAPAVSSAEAQLREAGIDMHAFPPATLRAIAAAGDVPAFIARYQALPPADRERFHSTLHFGSWRFWKADATLPTTRPQRADIRTELVKQFSRGTDLDRLGELRTRYNQKVLPLQTGRTHPRADTTDTLRKHILAHQDVTLDALREEKRHAKVQVGYGVVGGALSIAELSVNPGAAGVSATRALLSPVYLAYAGRRSLAADISRRNAIPVTAAMREEALLRGLPDLHARIASGGARAMRLRNPDHFLANTLKMSPGDIGKLKSLERENRFDEAHALLSAQAPDASIKLALRVLAEECSGLGTDAQQRDALAFVAREAALGSGDSHAALAGITRMSQPDDSYDALQTHCLEEAAYTPGPSLAALGARVAGGDAPSTLGFDAAPYRDRPAQEVTDALTTRFAADNPAFAARLFAAELRGGGPASVAARNTLRDFRFTETELGELEAMPKHQAAAWLESHLFGEHLRRRFSDKVLDSRGVDAASAVADRMPEQGVSAAEPLTWRLKLEKAGVGVIGNDGTPGLDSMLYALHQQFGGHAEMPTDVASRKVMNARRRILAEITAAQPDRHVDVARDRDTIVRIAADVFGKPGATVKIVDATGAGAPHIAGGAEAAGGSAARVDAVLCHDARSNRTFVLHGGDAEALPPRAESSAPPSRASSMSGASESASVSVHSTSSDDALELPLPDLGVDDFSGDVLSALGLDEAEGDGPPPVEVSVERTETTPEPVSRTNSRASSSVGGRSRDESAFAMRNQEDLTRFIVGSRPHGVTVAAGRSTVSPAREALFTYQGMVFRGDSRSPNEILEAGGFASRNPLDNDEHLLEAQGCAQAKGATGHSGVSTAKTAAYALPYCANAAGSERGYLYVIDTRRLGDGQHAYDMTETMVANGYMARPQEGDDPTGHEVNATGVSAEAIVGWVTVEDADALLDRLNTEGGDQTQALAELVRSGAPVHMNPLYEAD